MKKNFWVLFGIFLVALSFISVSVAETAPPNDVKKHTEAGKYVT